MNTRIIFTIISIAAFSNSYTMEQQQVNVNKKLIKAAATGNLEKLEEAIKEGADINYAGRYKYRSNIIIGPAIIQACYRGRLNIVKFLIEAAGISINTTLPNHPDYTIFRVALSNSNFDIAEYLIQKKVTVNSINYLHYNLDQIKFLVWHNIDHNYNGKNTNHFINEFKTNLLLLKLSKFIDTISSTKLSKRNHDELLSTIKKNEQIMNFLKKVQKIKGHGLKNIVQKVNKILRSKIHQSEYPKDLINLVSDYCMYPENYKDFLKLSDQEIDKIIEIHITNLKEGSQIDLSIFTNLPLSYN